MTDQTDQSHSFNIAAIGQRNVLKQLEKIRIHIASTYNSVPTVP